MAEQGVQNLSIEDCNKGHGLFTTQDEGECALARGSGGGMHGILSLNHLYIDMCTSYASTPYREILENLKKQLRCLCRHTNSGLMTMDKAGALGAMKKMWLNKDGVTSVIPLKILEKTWPVSHHLAKGMSPGQFIIHADAGDIMVHNNRRICRT